MSAIDTITRFPHACPMTSANALLPPARPQLPASNRIVRWVGSSGVVMLLIAATIAAVTHWQSIPTSAKLVAMWAAVGIGFVGSAALRQRLPIMSVIVEHLAVLLIPLAAMATAIGIGARWPTVVFVAGGVGIVAIETAFVLRKTIVFGLCTSIPAVLLSVGIAAQTQVPAGLVMAGFAVLTAARHRHILATWIGALAVFAPALGFVDSTTLGKGTLLRLGLRGHDLTWAGPTTGLVVAAAFGLVARTTRRASNDYLTPSVGAVLAIAMGAATALATVHASMAYWLCIPHAVWLVTECWLHITLRQGAPDRSPLLMARIEQAINLVEVLVPAFIFYFGVGLVRIAQWNSYQRWSAIPAALLATAAATISVERTRAVPQLIPKAGSWVVVAYGMCTLVMSITGWWAPSIAATGVALIAAGARIQHERLIHVGCALATVATIGMTWRLPLAHGTIGLATAAIGIGCIALAFWRTLALTYLDTVGVTASGMAFAIAVGENSLWTRTPMVTFGVVVAFYGMARLQRGLLHAGEVLALWSLLGNLHVIGTSLPFGVSINDAQTAVACVWLWWWCRHFKTPWTRTLPWLGLMSVEMISAVAHTHSQTRLIATVVLGVGSIAIGGLRNDRAALITGTITVASTFGLTFGHRLAQLPTWLWIAVGGALLIVVAAFIERRPPAASPHCGR